ncbi:MAG TPA: hypothetical protein VMJ10_31970 [Kofleriaceae bacterium]|nr:hypothetical protein [Kofleriaceae bacterium]
MRLSALVVVLAIGATARADGPGERAVLGDGYELVIDHHQLFVVRGKQRAPLGRADTIDSAKVGHRRVQIEAEAAECHSLSLELGFDELEAHLVNAAAYERHVHHDYAAAATGFARAAALAPHWPIPAYNLASADQLRGDLDGAIAALAPWLAKHPLATYLQVARDPELRPLLARRELAALRPSPAGTAKVDAGGIIGSIAYSPTHHALALTRSYGSGDMSGQSPSTLTDIAIFDTGGNLIATLPPDHATQTVLDELGFSPASVEQGSSLDNTAEKSTSKLPKAKLYVVIKDSIARAFRGDRELGHAEISEHFAAVSYVEDARVVVISWAESGGPDWCPEGEGTAMIRIP